MDRLYQHVKTGEKRHLPPFVYQANKKNWKEIPEESAEIESDTPGLSIPPVLTPVVELPASREALQAQYEALAGGKPDGRWSNQKLIQKIEELKEPK
jgi:hypothetical protein